MGTGRTRTRTIAVESEQPAHVARTVEGLGLDLRPNISYPRALRGLAGAGGSRYAVIDVGTNSVKLHIGERTGDGPWRTVADRAVVTRLGEGLDDAGVLQATPMARTIDAICEMADQARRAGAFDIAAVGTAGLRIAANAAEFVAAARGRCGVRVEVISGEAESRLGYLAARSLADRTGGSLVVFETGGGSSQFTFGHGDRVERALQRGRGRRAVHGTLRPRRHHPPRGRRERVRSDRRRPRPAGRARHAGHAHRDRRCVHQSRRRGARARDLRRRTSSTAPCSTARRSIARSRSTRRAPPRSGGTSSACSPLVPRSSSRARASSGPCWRNSGVHRRPSAIEVSGMASWRTGSGRPSPPRLRAAPPSSGG